MDLEVNLEKFREIKRIMEKKRKSLLFVRKKIQTLIKIYKENIRKKHHSTKKEFKNSKKKISFP